MADLACALANSGSLFIRLNESLLVTEKDDNSAKLKARRAAIHEKPKRFG
jgi:hypothetical protein